MYTPGYGVFYAAPLHSAGPQTVTYGAPTDYFAAIPQMAPQMNAMDAYSNGFTSRPFYQTALAHTPMPTPAFPTPVATPIPQPPVRGVDAPTPGVRFSMVPGQAQNGTPEPGNKPKASYDSDDEADMTGMRFPQATIVFESNYHSPGPTAAKMKEARRASAVASLDDFELIRVLGKGAFGKVWKVRRKGNNKFYAMKVLSKRHFAKENLVDLLKGEKATMAKVDHPNLVSLRWAWQTDDRAFLVMDYVPGGDLATHLQRSLGHHFDEQRARFYAAQVTLALEHLHRLHIVYRDMKPDNIVLDEHGNAMLIDFGLSVALPPFSKDGGRQFFGAPNYYISPEMIRGQPFGTEADWWMLGVTVYLMLTGTLPWIGPDPKEVHRQIISPAFPLKIPQDIAMSSTAKDFLAKILCKELKLRMTTADEVKAHPWFAGMSWELLVAKELPTPYRPPPEPEEDDGAIAQRDLSFCRVPTQALFLRGFSFARPGDPDDA